MFLSFKVIRTKIPLFFQTIILHNFHFVLQEGSSEAKLRQTFNRCASILSNLSLNVPVEIFCVFLV